MSGIHAFHPPSPASAVLEAGLATALAEYPEWAGTLVADASTGRTVLLLDDDRGVRFVEATADVDLGTAMPLLQPAAPEVRLLHPSSDGAVELMLVQVTRFTCGYFVVGHTMHHAVGDGLGICNALLAWGQATRGAAVDPVPVHDRTSFFVPRQPPQIDFEHRGVEFSINSKQACHDDDDKKHLCSSDDDDVDDVDDEDVVEDVVTHKVHFSREFVSSLKLAAAAATAGTGRGRTYSTTQCVVAHLWRCMAEVRRLDGDQVTTLHIAVNGRGRMRCPRVPEGYTGNVVLWAHPAATAGELLASPLSDVAEIVRRNVARVDDSYFRSFIDFISSGAVEDEGLLPMSDAAECPDAEVYCLRRIPFYDLHFAGGGHQFLFIPSYHPADGLVYLLPSSPLDDDGSIEAHVSLFSGAMDTFKNLRSSYKGVA